MAEVAATVPATVGEAQTVVPVKAAGRGRGKGKKGKGKFKGKAKAKKVLTGEEAERKPKEPKLNLRQQVEQEVGDRDIQEVIKESKERVAKLQAAVQTAMDDVDSYEKGLTEAKAKMQAASARVDECVHKETLALEKLKMAKHALIEIQKNTTKKRLALGEEEQAMVVLQNEGDQQKKEADLMKDKENAQAAKEAAKKAYNDAVMKAKAVAEEIKNKKAALAITDDPATAEKARLEAERAAEEEKLRKEAKSLGSAKEKELKAENKQLERERAERDKERARQFKEAAGIGGKKRALADGSAASPAKAGKVIQDVD